MICKIDFFSDATFDKDSSLQMNDDIKVGDNVYVAQGHELMIEHLLVSGRKLTIIDGEKILRLTVIS